MARGNPLVTINPDEERFNYQRFVNNLGNSLFDLEGIKRRSSLYPNNDNAYGTGEYSSARHRSASARASDKIANLFNIVNPFMPQPVREFVGDTGAFIGGLGVEGMGSLKDYAMSGFKDRNYLDAAVADIKDNYIGTYGTGYGEPTRNIVDQAFYDNGYILPNNNIFNARQLDFQPTNMGLPNIQNPHPRAIDIPEYGQQTNDDPRRIEQIIQSTEPVPVPVPTPYVPPQPTSISTVSSGPPRRSSRGGRTRPGASRNYGVTGRRVVGGR
jgi:hypothetical protein